MLLTNLVNFVIIGVNGQLYTVAIVSTPAGIPVSGSTNTFDYPILSSVTLTCMVTSSDGSKFTVHVTAYRWDTRGCFTNNRHYNPTCFPTGQTTQNVTDNDLLAEDAGTITCTATIGGVDYLSNLFTIRVSGKCTSICTMTCRTLSILYLLHLCLTLEFCHTVVLFKGFYLCFWK